MQKTATSSCQSVADLNRYREKTLYVSTSAATSSAIMPKSVVSLLTPAIARSSNPIGPAWTSTEASGAPATSTP